MTPSEMVPRISTLGGGQNEDYIAASTLKQFPCLIDEYHLHAHRKGIEQKCLCPPREMPSPNVGKSYSTESNN